jgi:hypothetical protein
MFFLILVQLLEVHDYLSDNAFQYKASSSYPNPVCVHLLKNFDLLRFRSDVGNQYLQINF